MRSTYNGHISIGCVTASPCLRFWNMMEILPWCLIWIKRFLVTILVWYTGPHGWWLISILCHENLVTLPLNIFRWQHWCPIIINNRDQQHTLLLYQLLQKNIERYLLPQSSFPFHPLDTIDQRYFNSTHVPIVNPLKRSMKIELYNDKWLRMSDSTIPTHLTLCDKPSPELESIVFHPHSNTSYSTTTEFHHWKIKPLLLTITMIPRRG